MTVTRPASLVSLDHRGGSSTSQSMVFEPFAKAALV